MRWVVPIVAGCASIVLAVLLSRGRERTRCASGGEVVGRGWRWSLYLAMLRETLRTGREVACVIYEDGNVECFLLGPNGGCYPIRHGVVEVVHTHPVPRWTPSIVDIAEAYTLSRRAGRAVPSRVVTYIPERREVVVYEVKVEPWALPDEVRTLLESLLPFEEMAICVDPEVASELQHEVMKVMPHIKVTRYVLKLSEEEARALLGG